MRSDRNRAPQARNLREFVQIRRTELIAQEVLIREKIARVERERERINKVAMMLSEDYTLDA